MSGRKRLPESEKRKRLVLYVRDEEREKIEFVLRDMRESQDRGRSLHVFTVSSSLGPEAFEDWEANRVRVESEGGIADAEREE